ncbi:lipocalin family protein [Marinomonas epiphytica]
MYSSVVKCLIVSISVFLSACGSRSIDPKIEFNLQPFVGTWYEIVRQNQAFEEGLVSVTTEIALTDKGMIKVLKRGYSLAEQVWREAFGRAFIFQSYGQSYLKIQFEGPFYGSYLVFELDQKNQQFATMAGPHKELFWLLSRSASMPTKAQKRILDEAFELGFEMDRLIEVSQLGPNP